MRLSIGMIADEMKLPIVHAKFNDFDKELNLTHFEIYEQELILRNDTAYIIISDLLYPYQLQTMTIENGAAIIYLGNFPEECFTENASFLIFNSEDVNVFSVINKIRLIFEKYHKLEGDLYKALYFKKNIQFMVNLMTPVFHNELTIRNNEYHYIAHSYEQIQLYSMSKLPAPDKTGIIPIEVVDLLKSNPSYKKAVKSLTPLVYQDDYFTCKILYYDVFSNDEFLCRIKLSETGIPLRNYDSELLLFFSGFVKLQYEMNFNLEFSQDTSPLRLAFIQLLQDSETLSDQELKKRLISKNWEPNQKYLCACLMPSIKDVQMRTLAYYSNALTSSFHDLFAFEYQEQIICIINLSFSYKGNTDAFTSQLVYFLREENFRAGFSNEFQQLAQLKYYYRQARMALDFGNTHSPSIWSHYFSNNIYYYILQKFKDDFQSLESCNEDLTVLKQSDTEKQTQYLQTLRVYLNNHMNSAQTAKELFIHRATLKYRLEKIKLLTNIDFEDVDMILGLQLFLKLMDIDV